MSLLLIEEHNSPHYGPRTWHNAVVADLTVAFAVDFDTRGEQLTERAAGLRYIGIPIHRVEQAAFSLIEKRALYEKRAKLNIAGNGIYTLAKSGWNQQNINQWVYEVLKMVHEHEPIEMIHTGGQTGVDIAGAVAAVALNIACVVTMPKGYRQRHDGGRDSLHTRDGIMGQIEGGAAAINKAFTYLPTRTHDQDEVGLVKESDHAFETISMEHVRR
jgi:hypothetical protein